MLIRISFLLSLLISSVFAYAQPQSASGTQKNSPQLSFVLTAPEGTSQKLGNGAYQLVFYRVTPYLTYYTERPARQAGQAQISNFIRAWSVGDNSFLSAHPNGVFFAGKVNGDDNSSGHFVVGMISKPQYNVEKEIFTCQFVPLSSQRFLFQKASYSNIMLTLN